MGGFGVECRSREEGSVPGAPELHIPEGALLGEEGAEVKPQGPFPADSLGSSVFLEGQSGSGAASPAPVAGSWKVGEVEVQASSAQVGSPGLCVPDLSWTCSSRAKKLASNRQPQRISPQLTSKHAKNTGHRKTKQHAEDLAGAMGRRNTPTSRSSQSLKATQLVCKRPRGVSTEPGGKDPYILRPPSEHLGPVPSSGS